MFRAQMHRGTAVAALLATHPETKEHEPWQHNRYD
jgi:hypothetical protein